MTPATVVPKLLHTFSPIPPGGASFASSPSSQTSTGMRQSRERDSRQVLVVDDDASILRLLRMIFREADFDVATSSNGQEALDAVEQSEPSAIVLDLEMPVMDGRTFVRELRSRGYKTPVLILSAYGARQAQRELDAQAGIDKPFDPDRVVAAVTSLLDSHWH